MGGERDKTRNTIDGFGDQATKDIFRLKDPKSSKRARKRIHHEQLDNAQSVLDDLNTCDHPNDLVQHRPHKMEGHDNWWILDINDKYGVIFGWFQGEAFQVQACDYHEEKFGPET